MELLAKVPPDCSCCNEQAPDGFPALVGGGCEQVVERLGAGKAVDAAAHQRFLVQLPAPQRFSYDDRIRHLDELRTERATRTVRLLLKVAEFVAHAQKF